MFIGNEVIAFGYPTSLSLQENKQLNHLYPLLRKGMVAGRNLERRSIILDCPVYYGNSGGPVVQVETTPSGKNTFSMIGVIGEFVPFIDRGQTFFTANNSGYSIATPMDFVFDLIKSPWP